MLTECKWTSKPIGSDILANLERKSSLIRPELDNRRVCFALCSRSGFTDELIQDSQERREVLLFDLPLIMG
jgi:hypothetical protein